MAKKLSVKTDVEVSDHFTIFLVRAVSSAGSAWVDEHLPDDAMHFGDAIVVEHRFISDIVAGMVRDGLTVLDTASGKVAAA